MCFDDTGFVIVAGDKSLLRITLEKNDNKISVSLLSVIKYPVFVFTLLFLLISVSVFYRFINSSYKDIKLSTIKADEIRKVKLQSDLIKHSLEYIKNDIKFLSASNSVRDVIENDFNGSYISRLEKDLFTFSKTNRNYFHVRVLDSQGFERARVNNKNRIYIVPRKELQNKSGRYYFKNILKLQKNKLYISRLDLNVENGDIESPYNPVIRFGSQLTDADSEFTGALFLNYNADIIISKVKSVQNQNLSQTILLNSDSYYLIGSPEKEWAFMFPEKKQYKFKEENHATWEKMVTNNSGQLMSSSGLYTFNDVLVADNDYLAGIDDLTILKGNDYLWKILSFIPSESLNKNLNPGILIYFLITAPVWFIIAFYLSKYILIRKISSIQKLEIEKKRSTLNMIITTNHELNIPIASIKGNLELLKVKNNIHDLTDSQKLYLQRIDNAIRSIETTLSKLKNANDSDSFDYMEN